jgi:DNA-binding transcriptional LysR family regulator
LRGYAGVNARELSAEVFRAVAQQPSFRKAAEDLYLTQPTVTLQVKALEGELGAKLFHRGSKGVALTEAGTLLLGYADQLHRLALEAETVLSDLRESRPVGWS